MPRHGFRIALGLAGIALLAGAFVLVRERGLRAGLDGAEEDLRRGRLVSAHRRLARLQQHWPGRSEVEFRLGQCELALSRPDAAMRAWARVPRGTAFAAQAAALRATLLTNRGHFAPAELLLRNALGEPGSGIADVRQALGRLYRFEGRVDDVRRLLEGSWQGSTDRAGLLKALWELDVLPWPVDGIRTVLDKAANDDDRVWLGRGNLATMTGRFDEAGSWLQRCHRVRPDDPVIWRARLDLAVAAGDCETLPTILPHLPADHVTPAQVFALRAWIPSQLGNRAQEREALAELLAREPANARALERAAELALEAGEAAQAAELRRRKAAVDGAKERYRALLGQGDPLRTLPELCRLSATLGRPFEARGWAVLLLERTPGDREARAILARNARVAPAASSRGSTLADCVADLLPRRGQASAPRSSTTIPRFRDDSQPAGLNVVFDHGATPLHQLPETMSGGVAVIDYDGDGRLDIYAVGGGAFPPDPSRPLAGDRLFRNNGDGTFADVTTAAGLEIAPRDYGLGVAVGDYDNDGNADLFITRWRSYALYHNRGDGTFEDATESAGLGGQRVWPTSAAFADLDRDGDLDLYVCHYCAWDPATSRPCIDPKKDVYIYCDPKMIDAAVDHVFRNDDGRFVDVTARGGFTDQGGRGLGVLAAHLDDDDRIDLFVANDMSANYLFRNRGNFQFEETGHAAGVAANAEGGYQAGMGIACGDLDGDGRVDLAVTNSYNESTTVYHNLGGGNFADWTAATGLGAATRYLVGFGIAFLDYDNDGRLDLIAANGNVNDGRPLFPWAMPVQLLAGSDGGRLRDVSRSAGIPWDVPRLGRGLAHADLDEDGRVDALIVSQGQPLAYFHNRTPGGHFLVLRLVGTASNRDGVGARVTVAAGGRRWVAQRTGGGSYLSAGEGRLHFGLGTATSVSSVEVRWPSALVQRLRDLAVDASYDIREGELRAR